LAKTYPVGIDPHQTEFVKLVRANTTRHREHEVFRDFCELSALSLSNAVDRIHYDVREARYLDMIKRYNVDEVARFPLMLAHLVESLEGGFKDCIGQLFMAMELGSHWNGQFFTPYEVCRLMAKITLTDSQSIIEQKGFITLQEPAAGAGAMVIACAESMKDDGVNYQRCLHVTAQDIDITAVHMAYVQFSLLHIPAIVIHGNTLALTEWDVWVTPAHVLGGWDHKLRRRRDDERSEQSDAVAPANSDAAPLEAERTRIVEFRTERAEQLGLFE